MTAKAEHAIQALNTSFINRYPSEAAQHISRLAVNDGAALMTEIPQRIRAEIWNRLPEAYAIQLLEQIPLRELVPLLSHDDAVHSARILAKASESIREALLPALDAVKRKELLDLVRYPDNSAGMLMNTRVAQLQKRMSIREVQQRLRKSKPGFTRFLFITDEQGILQDMVDIHDLALADPRAPLSDIAKPVLAAVLPTTTREEVVTELEQHHLTELPVIDIDGHLLGVIRHDTLVAAVREESSSDLLTMVGASKDERALSRVSFVVRKRLPWLQINLLTAFLAAAVVGLFENTIAQFTALAVLLPVVAGQSGNTGAQALAVTMRGLALREIGTSHWRRVARKEVLAGLINGIAIALVTALGVLLWSQSYGLALVIAVSMVIAMVAAALSGVVIPVVLTIVGQDPAQSSSIILTTVTDVVGFFTFLGIATMLSTML